MASDNFSFSDPLTVSQAVLPNFWESSWGLQILQQDREEFPYPWPESYWMQLKNDIEGGPHLYYETNEVDVRAWALFDFSSDEWGHLQKIFVSSSVQGCGFGTRFLRCCLNLCPEVEKIDLEVAADNRAAVSLYRQVGFSLICEEKGFYSDGRNAYKMSLDLQKLAS